MKKIFSILLGAAAMLMGLSSCVDDLDQKPIIGANSTTVYSTIDGYRSVLAKIYGSYSLVGQERASNVDLSSNKGEALLRNIFNLQEAPTDEVAYTWLSGDQLEPIVYMTWDASDIWVSDTYYRLYYSIALCNEFLRYCGDASIGGFNADEQAEIRTYAAEARFMRALSYYFVLDLFRKGPYVDEHTPTSGIIPPAYDGTQLYDFISSELLAIENALPEVNSYGRAGQAALWALGVRLNLNAKVYTGTEHYTECISYAKKIIASGNRFNLANFMRANINAAVACLKIGNDILFNEEKIKVDRITGHGGLFKTPGVGQRILAAALNSPISVMETAGEGGAWGMALLAGFLVNNTNDRNLADYLEMEVFGGNTGTSIAPTEEEVAGFNAYIENYKACLPIEEAAVAHKK